MSKKITNRNKLRITFKINYENFLNKCIDLSYSYRLYKICVLKLIRSCKIGC